MSSRVRSNAFLVELEDNALGRPPICEQGVDPTDHVGFMRILHEPITDDRWCAVRVELQRIDHRLRAIAVGKARRMVPSTRLVGQADARE